MAFKFLKFMFLIFVFTASNIWAENNKKYTKSEKKSQIGHPLCNIQKGYNYPGIYRTCNNYNFYIKTNYIYWQPLEDKLQAGYRDSGLTTPNLSERLDFDTDYSSGFKIGLGYSSKHDDWDYFVQYTYLRPNKSHTYQMQNSNFVFFTSTWFGSNNSASGNNIENQKIFAKWDMDFDKLVFEIARVAYYGQYLLLRPFMGIDAHWITQDYRINYRDIEIPIDAFSFRKNKLWALGPRIGLDTNWYLTKNFRILADIALSLSFSSIKISGDGLNKLQTTPVSTLPYSIKRYKDYILRHAGEFILGFGWGSYFYCDRYHFDLTIAYEGQYYSSTNYLHDDLILDHGSTIPRIVGNIGTILTATDLVLHGLNISARFDF